MVVFIAKQAVDSSNLTKFEYTWKNGLGSITANKKGKPWYKIKEIELSQEKFVKIVKDDPQKFFKGADTFTGSDFADTLKSLGGADVVKAAGGADIVEGGAGDDRLYGGGGDDRMQGDAGADLISGGAGDNLLTGNGGKDSFLFDAPLSGGNAPLKPGNHSRITDFELGIDTIQLDKSLFKDIGGKGKAACKLVLSLSRSVEGHPGALGDLRSGEW